MPLVLNRTAGGVVTPSFIEINTNDTAVRELRRAYYAVISFTDWALGVVLDELQTLKLDSSTIVTFIGDHGYQNGEKGEWCKSNNFELATRIPMYVSVPPTLGGGGWARGTRVATIVESVDLMPTLADLAGVPLPAQALAGESLRPLLTTAPAAARAKGYALSQWPRRPSCTTTHKCTDGGGDPFEKDPDQAVMGYKLRVDDWAYVAWFEFDWGDGADPTGAASRPVWEKVVARELYSHVGDDGSAAAGEAFEWENLADDAGHADVVARCTSSSSRS